MARKPPSSVQKLFKWQQFNYFCTLFCKFLRCSFVVLLGKLNCNFTHQTHRASLAEVGENPESRRATKKIALI